MSTEALSPIVEALGWSLVHFLWQGAVIGIVAWALLRALGGARPVLRYWVGLLGLGVMAVAPIITFIQVFSAPVPTAGGSLLQAPGVVVLAGDGGPVMLAEQLERLLPAAVALWLAGVLLMLGRLASDAWQLRQLVSQDVEALPGRWDAVVERLADGLGVRRPVRIFKSVRVSVPLVVGWLRPTILIPPSALMGLTPRQLELIIAHELAHVSRADWLVNLFQVVVETLLFYHPAVRLLSRRVRAEREQCCDDMVVAATGDTLTYARALTEVEGLRAALTTRMAVAATDGQLADRVTRLIVPPRRQRGFVHWTPVSMLVIATLVSLSVGQDWKPPAAILPAAPVAETRAPPEPPGLPDASRPVSPDPATGPAPDAPEAGARPGEPERRAGETAAAGQMNRTLPASPTPAAPDPVENMPAEAVPPAAEPGSGVRPDPEPEAGREADQRNRPSPAPVPAVAAAATRAPAAAAIAAPRERAEPMPAVVADSVVADPPPLPPLVPSSLAGDDVSLTAESSTETLVSESEADETGAESGQVAADEAADEPVQRLEYAGGTLIRGEPPAFPRRARTRAEEGQVKATYTVDKRGRVRDIEIVESSGRDFELAVKRVLKRWRFEPYTLEGEPVDRRVARSFDFELEAGGPALDDDSRCGNATASRLCRRYASAGKPDAPPPAVASGGDCNRTTGSRLCGRDPVDNHVIVVYQAD